jgi:hypothetical protein
MRVIGRLLALLLGAFVAVAIAGTFAARAAKERIVRHEDPDADEVALAAILEPLAFRSTATAFRGGTIDCWYGGGIVDLRAATLDPAGATLKVRALFGGGQIVVPDAWEVEAQVVGLGGAGDSRPKIERPADAPRLLVEGFALFGGFGISSVLPADAETFIEKTRAARAERAAQGSVDVAAEGASDPAPVPVMAD